MLLIKIYCRFRSFLASCRSFQVVSCSLQVVSRHFLLVVGRFRPFLVRCRLFQVVPCSLQVLSGRFFLIVGCFRLFLARCRSFQVVSGHFRSFGVLASTYCDHYRRHLDGPDQHRNDQLTSTSKFFILSTEHPHHNEQSENPQRTILILQN